MCGSRGSLRNWLRWCTTYVIGLVNVRYIKLPINLLYWITSVSSTPLALENLRFCSMGVLASLYPSRPVSWKISRECFLWFKTTPYTSVSSHRNSKNIMKRPQVLQLEFGLQLIDIILIISSEQQVININKQSHKRRTCVQGE